MNDFFVDLPPSSSFIAIMGIGSGGRNAVKHIHKSGIEGLFFMECDANNEALAKSPIPFVAEGNLGEIKTALLDANIEMLFLAATLGGGVGSGATPIVAAVAKEMGIFTIAVVTLPFKCEGERVMAQAMEGIEAIRQSVDSLLVINSDDVVVSDKMNISEGFEKVDDSLAALVSLIPHLISKESHVNIDFADIKTIITGSGIAIMGSVLGSGDNRALEVAEAALCSMQLRGRDILESKSVLISIVSGCREVTYDEALQILDFIHKGMGSGGDIIWGFGRDESLGDDIRVTFIATGIEPQSSLT